MKVLINILKGMGIGVANVIPGVSGGTVAFILGIYDRLIEAIGRFFTDKEKRKEYFWFLLSIAVGVGLGVVLFAWLMNILLEHFKNPTYFFFAGLIAGSVPVIVKAHSDMRVTVPRVLSLIAGFAVVLALILVSPAENPALKGGKKKNNPIALVQTTNQSSKIMTVSNLGEQPVEVKPKFELKYGLWLSFCGFAASGAMVVPGVSGSALLLALGEYTNVLKFVNNRDIVPLLFFALGVGLGILLFARVIDFCLKKFPSGTYYFILGLILASFYQMWLQVQPGLIVSGWFLTMCIVSLLVGFGIAFFLGRIEVKKA